MTISVCIPTYNQGDYIETAIRSAFEQTFRPLEIIVSDDSSTDNTPEILEALSLEIPILKVIRQPINLGMNRNTNTCLRLGTGDFIVKLDSDDYLAPKYIQELAELLSKFPLAGYAHAGVQEIDQYSRSVRIRRLARTTGFIPSDKALRASINGYQVAANIIMFRRVALKKVGYISSVTNFAEDYHLSASLAAQGFGNVYKDEILSYYRVWSDAGKARQRRKLDEIIGLRKIFEEIFEPAFLTRGWDLRELEKKRAAFATRHADCLGWSVYTKKEKAELARELNNLSSKKRARLSTWLYLNNLGMLESWPRKIKSSIKVFIKACFFGINKLARK